MITFTINDTEYQAEEGMTWGEWVESNYNTGRYSILAGYITDSDLEFYVYTNPITLTLATDIIISGNSYLLNY